MKKPFKSILASVMAMVMTVSLLPTSALAASVNFYKNYEGHDNDYYTVSHDTAFYLLSKDADIALLPDGAFYFVADDTDALVGTRNDGYSFNYWSFDYDSRIQWDEDPYLVTGDVNLYAFWQGQQPTPGPEPEQPAEHQVYEGYAADISDEAADEYDLFRKIEGTKVVATPNTASAGAEVTLSLEGLPSDYTFVEWFVAPYEICEDTDTYVPQWKAGDPNTFIMPDFSVEVHAYAEKVTTEESQSHTVTFVNGGGIGDSVVKELPAGSYTLPEVSEIGFLPKKDTLTFAGWLVNQDYETGPMAPGKTVTISADTEIRATWRTITYKVTFDANGGTGTMSTVTKEINSKFMLPECTFTPPAGKTFQWWEVTGCGQNAAGFGSGSQITMTSDLVLKAIWDDSIDDGGNDEVYEFTYYDKVMDSSKNNAVISGAEVKATINQPTASTVPTVTLSVIGADNYTLDKWDVKPYNTTCDTDVVVWVDNNTIELPWFEVTIDAYMKPASEGDNGGSTGDIGGGSTGGLGGSSSSTDKVTNADGSTTTTTTNKDGSVTEKTTFEDGSKSEITVKADGSAEFKAEMADGTTATATITAEGKVEATVELSEEATLAAAQANEVLPLPIPSVPVTTDRNEASVITVSASKNYAVKVEVPVENVTPGTVVIIVDKDGNETIVTKSSVTENGVVFAAQGDVTVKIVDNSKSFGDVKSTFWGNNSVAFVTSRELFSGTSADSFSPNEPMTRAMIFTVLARLDGQDPTGGANWWDKGMDWAKNAGLTDGTNPQTQLTREQLAVMLYNYSGKPAVDTSKLDKTGVSNWAENAMAWAVSQGVMAGDQNGNLNAGSNATRAEVATMLMSFVGSNNK